MKVKRECSGKRSRSTELNVWGSVANIVSLSESSNCGGQQVSQAYNDLVSSSVTWCDSFQNTVDMVNIIQSQVTDPVELKTCPAGVAGHIGC
jgi:hypothetical protein